VSERAITIPFSEILDVRVTTLQGGGNAVSIECADGESHQEPCRAEDAGRLAALATRWAEEARADASASGAPRCAICHAPVDGAATLVTCPVRATTFHRSTGWSRSAGAERCRCSP
jgi:hypothetical protein